LIIFDYKRIYLFIVSYRISIEDIYAGFESSMSTSSPQLLISLTQTSVSGSGNITSKVIVHFLITAKSITSYS